MYDEAQQADFFFSSFGDRQYNSKQKDIEINLRRRNVTLMTVARTRVFSRIFITK